MGGKGCIGIGITGVLSVLFTLFAVGGILLGPVCCTVGGIICITVIGIPAGLSLLCPCCVGGSFISTLLMPPPFLGGDDA